ncbi:glutathione S-transferase family protein [uncultured Pelagimonas sp.]|uniref:glutathione S-transferase family protein n=1 Tax=uncultured Pelagimonas sp. TaxID=1618102 RepID=UPI00262CE05E|nr:glutathione S-transferase family protein [uncultured Pelagimonas sp.]
MSYTLYGSPKSRTFRVMWMMEELGQEYDLVPAAPQSDEIRAVSPLGKVPALKAGDEVIPDSSAILTYLADKHGALTAPAGSVARAKQDAMTFRILDDIEAQLWTAARHSFILPEGERVAEVKPTCRAEYKRNVDKLMAEVDGPFLMGETFTIPDIVLTHLANWAISAKFPEPSADFAAYLKRTRARPAFKAARDKQ